MCGRQIETWQHEHDEQAQTFPTSVRPIRFYLFANHVSVSFLCDCTSVIVVCLMLAQQPIVKLPIARTLPTSSCPATSACTRPSSVKSRWCELCMRETGPALSRSSNLCRPPQRVTPRALSGQLLSSRLWSFLVNINSGRLICSVNSGCITWHVGHAPLIYCGWNGLSYTHPPHNQINKVHTFKSFDPSLSSDAAMADPGENTICPHIGSQPRWPGSEKNISSLGRWTSLYTTDPKRGMSTNKLNIRVSKESRKAPGGEGQFATGPTLSCLPRCTIILPASLSKDF